MTPTMMVPRTDPGEAAPPARNYEQDFLDAVRALKPSSVLDIGCGQGALLQALMAGGRVRGAGLEPEDAAADRARALGLEVHSGRAEALPFADKSFDVVTLEYVAHHVEHLPRGLVEAVRVARQAVLILDGWFDISLPSQRVACDLDDWTKRIDRRRGMVHNSCPRPCDLIAPLLASGPVRIDYTCQLDLRPRPLAKVEAEARRQLDTVPPAPDLAADLDRILDQARLYGCSSAGRLLLTARLP